ncbi:unnamed protein product [Bursaphelenchus okinawaensis]|uniref:Uncharacterized protein n=1 Tax=Bursaphelenchus okinawaensis TaxID=465554 RepID=A0A811JRN3_9BILA|nr:unnamed protein product [Bursaphelenchus okinawaensis]CAG9080063.1 unnamed protein product [Bursaphelenchus okinawaensis]
MPGRPRMIVLLAFNTAKPDEKADRLSSVQLNELPLKPQHPQLRWNQTASNCMDEVMEIVKEVLGEYRDRLEFVDVESFMEEPKSNCFHENIFYSAHQTVAKQDQRGGFIMSFENLNSDSSSINSDSKSQT